MNGIQASYAFADVIEHCEELKKKIEENHPDMENITLDTMLDEIINFCNGMKKTADGGWY